MKNFLKIINAINICKRHKKNVIKISTNPKGMIILYFFLKIKILSFLKKIKSNVFLIKMNNSSNFEVNPSLRKKKITITKKSKIKNNIMVVSTDRGLSLFNNKNRNYGIVVAKINI
jgi:ligand-binding sensor domain-containing protein